MGMETGEDPAVTVVVPAFNERARIGATLRRVTDYFRERGRACELIVVDDGSTDGTPEFVRGLRGELGPIKLVENGINQGKGESVSRGLSEACAPYVLFTDADLSTPIEEFEKLRRVLESGCDIAIGSRAMSESRLEVRQPWYRVVLGKAFNKVVRILAVRGIRDTQCGFKALRREVLPAVLRRRKLSGFAFDVEFLFLARRMGYRIAEVPVVWRHDEGSKVNVLKHGLHMLSDLVGIRVRSLFGAYRLSEGAPRRIRQRPRLGPLGGRWPEPATGPAASNPIRS